VRLSSDTGPVKPVSAERTGFIAVHRELFVKEHRFAKQFEHLVIRRCGQPLEGLSIDLGLFPSGQRAKALRSALAQSGPRCRSSYPSEPRPIFRLFSTKMPPTATVQGRRKAWESSQLFFRV
jgi:hypothetical protein